MASTPFPTVNRRDLALQGGITVSAITTTDESGSDTGYTIDLPDEPLTADGVATLVDGLERITGRAA